jgi:hypothetical protein
MGTEGLYRYQDGKWTSYPYLPHNLGDAISIDGAGNMWFCGFENQPNGTSVYTLYKFDIDSQSFQTFPIPRMWEFGAQYLWTNKFAITDKGILWCASYWGISAFDGRYWYGPYLNPEDRRGATYCTVDPRQRVWFFGEDLFYVDGNDIPKEGWPGYSGIYEDTPLQLSLRNSPNPFNPSTTLSFSLPRTGNTLLSIYSITGQKVCTLVSGPMSAGKHSVVWDGRDDSGNLVSSGVYLSRLETGKLVSTAKMLLMK